MLESLGSARIEGNHTTLADYVESSLQGGVAKDDNLREVTNIEAAMTYIETSMEAGLAFSEHFVRELHAIAVRDLEREGDKTPGAYRTGQVHIAQSDHLPPEPVQVPGYMQELVAFIEDVLQLAVKKRVVKSGDLGGAMPKLNATQRTYQIKKLVERRMLQPIEASARQYTIGFDNNYLMRGIIHALSREGFISAPLAGMQVDESVQTQGEKF